MVAMGGVIPPMTPPMVFNAHASSPSILRTDVQYESNFPLPPSSFINLPPLNIFSPPLQLSTLSPSNEIKMLPPGNVTIPLPPYDHPLPLPTMLINTSSIPFPPSSSAIPPSLSPAYDLSSYE